MGLLYEDREAPHHFSMISAWSRPRQGPPLKQDLFKPNCYRGIPCFHLTWSMWTLPSEDTDNKRTLSRGDNYHINHCKQNEQNIEYFYRSFFIYIWVDWESKTKRITRDFCVHRSVGSPKILLYCLYIGFWSKLNVKLSTFWQRIIIRQFIRIQYTVTRLKVHYATF